MKTKKNNEDPSRCEERFQGLQKDGTFKETQCNLIGPMTPRGYRCGHHISKAEQSWVNRKVQK